MTYCFSFYGPKIGGGGVLLPGFCPKESKTLKFGLFLGYFCLLWAGLAEQCCTPVYLPVEDFRQKLPFFWDSLAPKSGLGGSPHPNLLPNHQKPWNSAYLGVFLSALGWCCRTVLHTSVPV